MRATPSAGIVDSRNEPLSELVASLKSTDRFIREDAANELAQSGDEKQAAELCRLLYDVDISVRNLAAEILVKIGKAATKPLLDESFSPDKDVRKFIVDIMALTGDSAFVPRLVELLNDPNDNVVGSAAEALGRIGRPEAVPALIDCCRLHPLAELQAIEALGNIGSPEAMPVLREKTRSNNIVIVYAAVEALGKIGSPEAAQILFELLGSDNKQLRGTVLSTIIKIAGNGGRKKIDEISGGQIVDMLIDAALSDDPGVRSAVIRELAFWSGPKVTAALIKALNDPDQSIVDLALGALRIAGDSGLDEIKKGIQQGNDLVKKYLIEVSAFLKSSELFGVVLPEAKSPDPNVRIAVCKALSKYSNSQAIEALLALADDEVGHVRAEALKSLGFSGDISIVERLFKYLDDEYPDVREACLGAMILIDGSKTVEFFKKDLEQGDKNRKILAARALGWIGSEAAANILLEALGSDVAEVRKYALLGLAKIGHSKLEENLTYLLTDESPEVRKAVVDAYLSVAKEKAADHIQVLLDDDDPWVRFYTINALAGTCDRKCLDKLAEIALNQPPFIQIAIVNFLSKSGEPKAISALQRLAASENDEIRAAAQEALDAPGN